MFNMDQISDGDAWPLWPILGIRNLSQGTTGGYEISILSLAYPFVGNDLQQNAYDNSVRLGTHVGLPSNEDLHL